MKEIKINPNGGTIKLNFVFRKLVLAFYAFNLYEKNSNDRVIKDKVGNNINDEDDNYQLPNPPNSNDGRIVHLMTSIDPLDVETDYEIVIEVIQDGIIIGTENRDSQGKIKPGDDTRHHMLAIKLIV